MAANGGRLPDFVVIGTMKAGTTSLHSYLSRHPDIHMSRRKELNFFCRDSNWRRGLDWYKAHFRGSGHICGESSPNYSFHPVFKDVPERMHSMLPHAKLIYVLRDPIERLISNYVHHCRDYGECRPIDEALLRGAYLSRSLYYMQLVRFLKYYPLDSFLLLTQEELAADHAVTLRRIYRFLGVDESFTSPREIRYHVSASSRRPNRLGAILKGLPTRLGIDKVSPLAAYGLKYWLSFPFSSPIPRPTLSQGLRDRLSERLQDDVNKLRSLTGMRFEQWSI